MSLFVLGDALPEAGTAMMLSPAVQCLVLAGDNKQLPATVISVRAEKAGFGRRCEPRREAFLSPPLPVFASASLDT